MWRQNLGIEVEIQQVEWATYIQDLHRNRLQVETDTPNHLIGVFVEVCNSLKWLLEQALHNRKIARTFENSYTKEFSAQCPC